MIARVRASFTRILYPKRAAFLQSKCKSGIFSFYTYIYAFELFPGKYIKRKRKEISHSDVFKVGAIELVDIIFYKTNVCTG